MLMIDWHQVLVAAGDIAIIGVVGSFFILGTPSGRVVWNYWGATLRLGVGAGIALALSIVAMFVAFVLPWATPFWVPMVGVAAAFVAPLAGPLLVVAAVDIVLGAFNKHCAGK